MWFRNHGRNYKGSKPVTLSRRPQVNTVLNHLHGAEVSRTSDNLVAEGLFPRKLAAYQEACRLTMKSIGPEGQVKVQEELKKWETQSYPDEMQKK